MVIWNCCGYTYLNTPKFVKGYNLSIPSNISLVRTCVTQWPSISSPFVPEYVGMHPSRKGLPHSYLAVAYFKNQPAKELDPEFSEDIAPQVSWEFPKRTGPRKWKTHQKEQKNRQAGALDTDFLISPFVACLRMGYPIPPTDLLWFSHLVTMWQFLRQTQILKVGGISHSLPIKSLLLMVKSFYRCQTRQAPRPSVQGNQAHSLPNHMPDFFQF